MKVEILNDGKEFEINPDKVINFLFSENGEMVEATHISLTELRDIFNERTANMSARWERAFRLEQESKGEIS